MPTGDNSAQVIDIDELNEIMNSDETLIKECFAEFFKDWPVLYVEIKGAVLKKDGQALDTSAHRLKGSLKYLAAEQAAAAAFRLEKAGKENNFQNIEPKLEELKNECQRVVEYIKDFDN